MIDRNAITRAMAKTAFRPQGACVLKSALSHLRFAPAQVAALDRWLMTHNGLISYPRPLMRSNRGRLDAYLQSHEGDYPDELQTLATTLLGMGYRPDGWELLTLRGFFLACHVVTQPQVRTTTPFTSTLRLL
ncbi:MAG: hypothetical protein P8J32_04135 [bacterium]|nr:hypothetical protein [bacterium]